jgi:hypothetical protein
VEPTFLVATGEQERPNEQVAQLQHFAFVPLFGASFG